MWFYGVNQQLEFLFFFVIHSDESWFMWEKKNAMFTSLLKTAMTGGWCLKMALFVTTNMEVLPPLVHFHTTYDRYITSFLKGKSRKFSCDFYDVDMLV